MRTQFTPLEKRLMELYSNDWSYEDIQATILEEFPEEDLSGPKMGYRMSELRKKAGCSSLFTLGLMYKEMETERIIKQKEAFLRRKLEIEMAEARSQFYNEGFKMAQGTLSGADKNKGINLGLFFATLFWLAMYLLTLNQL